MATVINNPGSTDTGGNGIGFVVGVILLILFAVFLLAYGLPAIRRGFGGPTQVTVPGEIDVNVNTPQGGEGAGQAQ